MTQAETGTQAAATPWAATAWTCPECSHCNLAGAACEACGVALRYHHDPPLDLPFTPRLSELHSFWMGLLWGVAALAGGFALLNPQLRETIGPTFLLIEVTAAGAAAVSSLFTAAWDRIFNQVELSVPPHAAAGTPIEVKLRLVPYRSVENVTVRLALSDRFYQKVGREVERRTKQLEASVVMEGGRLPGRRTTEFGAAFRAPFPVTAHTSTHAEISAGVLQLLSFVVPSLRFAAANQREHGGYYIEAYVRVGLLSRRYHKRVFTYAIGEQIFVG